jgi:hypothetical protein
MSSVRATKIMNYEGNEGTRRNGEAKSFVQLRVLRGLRVCVLRVATSNYPAIYNGNRTYLSNEA